MKAGKGSLAISTNGLSGELWFNLAEAVLERLQGRFSLIQPHEERYQLAASALENSYKQSHREHFPPEPNDQQRKQFIEELLSYGIIETFLQDPSVEDIMINATEPIFIHRTGTGLVKTDKRFSSNRELFLFVKKLVVFGGRQELEQINDIELADVRGRVNVVVSPFGPQITITRGKPQPLTILQLIEWEMLTYELAAQLWIYVEGLRIRPANLIIAGGPGTGKTTLLNALLSFIPHNNRIVIIEDTLELNTAFLEACSRLESCRRVQTPDLVKNSLRMRPDRILVGEVRGEEARDMMTAMSLGKYCMSTVHASTARETILRLQNEPMNVPPILVSLVDVFIIIRKLQREDKVTRMVCEVVETSGMEQQIVLISQVWRFDPEQGKPFEALPSSTFRDKLAIESGLSTLAIIEETKRRAKVLRAMAASSGRFKDIAQVTAFCQQYSADPRSAIEKLGISFDRKA